jgi:hypothetical protein
MIKLGGIVELQALATPGRVVSNPFAKAFTPIKEEETIEEQDHEVSMAQSSLDSIMKYTNDLKQQLGNMEKEIPAWIQDHISKSENYIQQAANFYHEYEGVEAIEEGRGLKTISKDLDKVLDLMQKHLELYKKSKGTPEEKTHIEHLKKLTKQKNDLTKEMNAKVSDMHKDAELQERKKINEASLVSFNELDPKIQSKIKLLEKLIGGKHTAIFDGIHGMIVDIKKSSMGGPYRFDASQLNQLLKANIRWVEGDKNGVSIGF